MRKPSRQGLPPPPTHVSSRRVNESTDKQKEAVVPTTPAAVDVASETLQAGTGPRPPKRDPAIVAAWIGGAFAIAAAFIPLVVPTIMPGCHEDSCKESPQAAAQSQDLSHVALVESQAEEDAEKARTNEGVPSRRAQFEQAARESFNEAARLLAQYIEKWKPNIDCPAGLTLRYREARALRASGNAVGACKALHECQRSRRIKDPGVKYKEPLMNEEPIGDLVTAALQDLGCS